MTRIHESLHHLFLRHRMVLWYDGDQEWEETAAELFPACPRNSVGVGI